MSPGRRTNRENFRSCQRTSVFLLFPFEESIRKRGLYLLVFQSSAGGSQAGAAELVQSLASPGLVMCAGARFLRKPTWVNIRSRSAESGPFVKIRGTTALDAAFLTPLIMQIAAVETLLRGYAVFRFRGVKVECRCQQSSRERFFGSGCQLSVLSWADSLWTTSTAPNRRHNSCFRRLRFARRSGWCWVQVSAGSPTSFPRQRGFRIPVFLHFLVPPRSDTLARW